jgi:threonine dehydratase
MHPFNDERMIEGNGTITLEILKDINEDIDYIICPMGGGGLVSRTKLLFYKKL